MNAGTLGVMIPIIALCIPLMAIWTRHRQKIAEMEIQANSRAGAEQAAHYAAQHRDLEERVQVLERIVTDRGYDVATRIEALRDARRVDDLLEQRSGEGARK